MAADPLSNGMMPKLPQPYGTASVQQRVTDIAGTDSPLNQMARTEAAKVMNSRGMLNSSMYAGAAQDAVLRNAIPIASQDASQAFQGSENALQRQFQGSENAADRALQEKMQQASLTAAEQSQIRDIQYRQGSEAADRYLQTVLQANDISAKNQQQQADIKFQTQMQKLSRQSQEKIASWQLKSSDRNAAAQLLSDMESKYSADYNSIMANTNLDATTRAQQLAAAKALRDRRLNLTEQMYNIDLKW